MTSWRARGTGAYDAEGLPLEAPTVSEETPAALRLLGLPALADELEGLRSTDTLRRPFVWRALASATDVDAVRLRPLPGQSAPRARRARWPLDFAIALTPRLDPRLAHDGLVIPRDALAILLQPIVAGILVDDGCARDLGTAEPLVLSPQAAAMVDARLDAALEDRPLVVSAGTRVATCRALRGDAPAIAAPLARHLALDVDAGGEVVVHLPLGVLAIEEAWALMKRGLDPDRFDQP